MSAVRGEATQDPGIAATNQAAGVFAVPRWSAGDRNLLLKAPVRCRTVVKMGMGAHRARGTHVVTRSSKKAQ